MKKVLLTSIVASSAILAQTIDIKSGWNFVGASSDIELTKFQNSCVDYIFKYDDFWKVYVANGEDYGKESNIEAINKNDGFYIHASSDCQIQINDIVDENIISGTPIITSNGYIKLAEDNSIVTTLQSIGSTKEIKYSIVGGSDHSFFKIDDSNNLVFKFSPDFEDIMDIDQNNIYEVKVQATDGTLSSVKKIQVEVTDVATTPVIVTTPYGIHLNDENWEYQPQLADGIVASVSVTLTLPNGDTLSTLAEGESVSNDDNTLKLFISNNENKLLLQSSSLSIYSYKFPTGSYSGTVTVTDTNGKSIQQNFDFIVTDSISELTKPAVEDIDMVVQPGAMYEIPFQSNDNFPVEYFVQTQPAYGMVKYKNGKWYYYTESSDLVDSFTYIAKSNSYNQSDEKTVNLKIMGNLAPEINDISSTVDEDGSVDIKLVATDNENDPITFNITSDPVNGIVNKKDDNTFTYTPNSDFVGSDSFKYVAFDGKNNSIEKTISITVANVNDTPIIDTPPSVDIQPSVITDKAFVIDQNSLFLWQSTLSKDADKDSLTTTVVTQPVHGTVKFFEDGGYVYAPDFGYEGFDSFSYKVSDGVNDSQPVTVDINVKNAFDSHKRVVTKTGSVLSTNKNGIKRDSSQTINDDPTTLRGTDRQYSRDDVGIVTDHITGLMWQDDGDNLKDITGTLIGSDPKETVRVKYAKLMNSYDDAVNYCSNLTLGGYSDWRVPKDMEFKTLTDYGIQGSSELLISLVGTNEVLAGKTKTKEGLFKNIVTDVQAGIAYKPGWVYTSTKERNIFMKDSYGDYVVFNPTQGRSTSYEVSRRDPGAMCVRGEELKEGSFIRNDGKGVVLDTTTNLMWQDGREFLEMYRYFSNLNPEQPYGVGTDYVRPFRTKSLEDAVEYCQTLDFGGYDDWVLPNMNELMTLTSNVLNNETKDMTKDGYILDSDKQFQARDFQMGTLLSSTPNRLREVELDRYFFFDENGQEVTGDARKNYTGYRSSQLPMPYSLVDELELNASNDTPIIHGGVDFSACKNNVYIKDNPNDNMFNIVDVFYEQKEEGRDCRKAAATYCRVNWGSTWCDSTALANDVAIHSEVLEGNPSDNWKTLYDVRCMRKADNTDIEAFYNDMKEQALSTPPKSVDWEYDKTTKKVTNKINGYVYDRFEDRGNTIKDIMANVEILKSNISEGITWSEAKQKADELGAGWRLMNKEHTQFLWDWTDLGKDGSITLNEYLTDSTDWNSGIWLQKEHKEDNSQAYQWIYDKYSTGTYMQAYASAYGLDKTQNSYMNFFPIKSDKLEAMAGSDQYVRGGDTITLDASNSHEGYGGDISYKWEYVESNVGTDLRDKIVINNANSKIATVPIPDVTDVEKEIRFKLTMTRGLEVSTDEMEVLLKSSQIVKLDSSGAQLPIDSEEYSCIKDTKTGLIWEVKTSNTKDLKTEHSRIGEFQGMVPSCGKSWRIPTKAEFVEAKNNPTLRTLANVMNRDSDVLYDGGEYDLYWINDNEILSLINTDEQHTAGRLESVFSGDTAYAEEQNIPKTESIRFWFVADE
jgi:hypothetical protein